MPKRIAIVCTARPSWAKLKPVVTALHDAGLDVDLIGAAYALTHGRGAVVDPDFQPTTTLTAALDANTGESSALTTGLLTLQLAQHFRRVPPALVIINHDRHEVLAGAIAASYQHVPILHLGGGEQSGNIDDKVRDANSALSDYHAVATELSRRRLLAMGHATDRVVVTGCPSIDLCREALSEPPITLCELQTYGTGAVVNPSQPFSLVLHHPTTDHPDSYVEELAEAIALAHEHGQVIVFWPGADEGMDAGRKYLTTRHDVRLIRSLPPDRYLRLLSQAAFAVGNSSSLVREASYFGTPRLILGDRQRGREGSTPPYPGPCTLYGDGYAAQKIAELCQQIVGR